MINLFNFGNWSKLFMRFLTHIIITLCFFNFLSSPSGAAPIDWLYRLEVEDYYVPAPRPNGEVQPISRYAQAYEALNKRNFNRARQLFLESKAPQAKSMLALIYLQKLVVLDPEPQINEIERLLLAAGTPVAKANRARLILAGKLVIRGGPRGTADQVAGDLLKESGTEEAKKDLAELKNAGLYESGCGCGDCKVM
jgi:hypothetical protein